MPAKYKHNWIKTLKCIFWYVDGGPVYQSSLGPNPILIYFVLQKIILLMVAHRPVQSNPFILHIN